MQFLATTNNVIIKVQKPKLSPDELLVESDENQEKILLGHIVTAGPDCDSSVKESKGIVCAYKSRVAALPWSTDEEEFYTVKEENIYGILEE